ncbi:TIGR00295 family protein [Methanobrevibacter sp.]|uniref:TIGR00295 family protein n=1 Tax=Methanobrevibacter sp. TaxID=66852 RepID=UPI00388D754B
MEEIEILKKENTPQNVIDHSIAVCIKAQKIAENFPKADKELIKTGALLHDIGRSRTHGIRHAVVGCEIARGYGYPENVLNIIERHIGAGITKEESSTLDLFEKSYVPQSLEEKIVAHADNLISGTKEVDVDYVIKKWESRMENPEDNIKRLIKLDEELIQAFKDD